MEGMQKLLNDFSSWYWWVSVVAVGIVVNLMSAYAKDPLDRWLAARNRAAAERREQESAERKAALMRQVNMLMSHPMLLELSIANEMRWRFYSLMLMILSTVLISVAISSRGGFYGQAFLAFVAFSALGALGLSMWAYERARKFREWHVWIERVITGGVLDRQ